jgi:hypothetical protein
MLAPPPKDQYIEILRSRIVEGRTSNPYEYRAIIVPIWVTLSSTNPRGNATFNIPSNQRFRVKQILPHVVPVDVTSAANAITNAGNFTPGGGVYNGGDVSDRQFSKAMNCRISLALNSRTFELFPQYSFPLSDLMSFDGTDFSMVDMPMILTQGTAIDLTASLTDTAAGIADGPTQYGLILVGSYINTLQGA